MTTHARLRLVVTLCVALLAVPAMQGFGPRGPQPAISIPLEPLGYEPLPAQFLLAGSSMLTVHYVDDQHLLLTYYAKRLLKRLGDCPPDDQDRSIDALLLELPSGKLLARTQWRVHDRGQYLWSLGHGRFLLRVRNTLYTFAPLANLATGHPFAERPLVTTQRHIEVVLLSPDTDLMILESKQARVKAADPATDLGMTQRPEPDPVEVDFFRVVLPETPADVVQLQRAGQIFTPGTGRVPANSSGYVAILDQGRQHWAFDFRLYGGKVKELAGFDSTCRPTPFLVSRSEFVAFGCHSQNTQQVAGGFNMRGEEMWEQRLSDTFIAPMFAFAPASGRFALSRLVSHAMLGMDEPIIPELVGPQTVVVYQTDSGKQILRVDCSPIELAGQNFALSPNGMSLAVIRNESIEVYSLPPLTVQEQKAVELAMKSAPEETNAEVQFETIAGSQESKEKLNETENSATTSSSPGSTADGGSRASTPGDKSAVATATATTENGVASAAPEATPEAAPAAAPAPAATGADQADGASQDQATPRKPPTLYTRPEDKPGGTSSEDKSQPQ